MSQTAVNDMGGATSPVALLVTSGAIALTLLFFATFFHNLPEPVLGAIVLMAASRLVRVEDLRRLRVESHAEFWTAVVASLGVLFFGLLDGLLLAAVGSLVMLIAHASRPIVVILGRERNHRTFRQSGSKSGCERYAWCVGRAQHEHMALLQRGAYPPPHLRFDRCCPGAD